MKAKPIAGTFLGVIVGFLGLVWFLQGAGALRMRPILCIADCEEVVGPSPLWAISGIITLIIGVIAVFLSVSRFGSP